MHFLFQLIPVNLTHWAFKGVNKSMQFEGSVHDHIRCQILFILTGSGKFHMV